MRAPSAVENELNRREASLARRELRLQSERRVREQLREYRLMDEQQMATEQRRSEQLRRVEIEAELREAEAHRRAEQMAEDEAVDRRAREILAANEVV